MPLWPNNEVGRLILTAPKNSVYGPYFGGNKLDPFPAPPRALAIVLGGGAGQF